MEIYKKQVHEFNQYESMVDSIKNAIKREIPYLINEYNLTTQQINSLNEYVNDRFTMFRYLRKNSFNLPTTLSLLLDNIKWRLNNNVDFIRISNVSNDFLNNPLVYFYKGDKLNRPNLIIRLAYLPTTDGDVTEFLTPLIIFILETTRLLLFDLSNQGDVVFDTNVLIDFKNAKSLPSDIGLIKSLLTILRRYPGLVGTVNLVNFGWMYQGLWQMCKLVLSNEAKAKVNFPSVKALKTIIDEDNLQIDFGGTNSFEWTLSDDDYFMKYRPDIPTLSRSSSTSSIYYDIINSNIPESSSFSIYNTPLASLTPVASHANLTNLAKAYSKLGAGMPPRFRNTKIIKQLSDLFISPMQPPVVNGIDSIVLTEKLSAISEQDNQVILKSTLTPENNPSSPIPRGWLIRLILKFESNIRKLMIRSFKKLVQYKSTFYWAIACLLLRNGVQELCQHIFLMMMEVMLIGQPANAGSIGMRSMLGLTTGQMTL